jgi:hypothetical protein
MPFTINKTDHVDCGYGKNLQVNYKYYRVR